MWNNVNLERIKFVIDQITYSLSWNDLKNCRYYFDVILHKNKIFMQLSECNIVNIIMILNIYAYLSDIQIFKIFKILFINI